MDKMQLIVKREFERVSLLTVSQVEFTADEEIIVTTIAGRRWVMQIGSDDDEFVFLPKFDTPAPLEVSFPFPPDWDEAIDENNFS